MQRYSLSAADVKMLVKHQNGTCALCDGQPLLVDHDHVTGRVRGLVCYTCNLKLAGLDDISWRDKAANYRALFQ